MIHTDGRPTIACRAEPAPANYAEHLARKVSHDRKSAFRLRRLAPLTYRRLVRAGKLPKV